MPIKIEVEPEEVVERETDSRGRLTLGSDWKNQEVKLLIISDPDPEDDS
jgi:hypothetical protein